MESKYYIEVAKSVNGNLLPVIGPYCILRKGVWTESPSKIYRQFFVYTSPELDKYTNFSGELWECEVKCIQRYYGIPGSDSENEFFRAKKNKKSTKDFSLVPPEGSKCVKYIRLTKKIYPESNLSSLGDFFVNIYSKIKSFIL